MSRSWRWGRPLVGAAVLAVVVWTTGTGPFVAGVRSLDAVTLLLGAALAVPITVAGAWRWRLVARGLGVGIGLAPAVAACYRAQLLNTTLPGGVLGDVHRGVSHGRDAGTVGRGLRSVVWERVAGQVVQAVLVVALLLVLPSPVRSSMPLVLALVVALSLLAVRATRASRLLRDDVRRGLLGRGTWPGVVVASTVAVAGHVATYLLAARAVGVTVPTATLLPLALLVLVAAALPLNLAGWGPREGMAAWTFAAAGLGAETGVATAVAYGAIVLVATLPGAVVLLAPRRAVRVPEPVTQGGA